MDLVHYRYPQRVPITVLFATEPHEKTKSARILLKNHLNPQANGHTRNEMASWFGVFPLLPHI